MNVFKRTKWKRVFGPIYRMHPVNEYLLLNIAIIIYFILTATTTTAVPTTTTETVTAPEEHVTLGR